MVLGTCGWVERFAQSFHNCVLSSLSAGSLTLILIPTSRCCGLPAGGADLPPPQLMPILPSLSRAPAGISRKGFRQRRRPTEPLRFALKGALMPLSLSEPFAAAAFRSFARRIARARSDRFRTTRIEPSRNEHGWAATVSMAEMEVSFHFNLAAVRISSGAPNDGAFAMSIVVDSVVVPPADSLLKPVPLSSPSSPPKRCSSR